MKTLDTTNVVQNLQVVPPKPTAKDTEIELKCIETLWSNRLQCEYPQGLNWITYDRTQRYKQYNKE